MDFEKELQQLVALESVVVQIDTLQQRVVNEGMSKEMAMEAMKLIPDFNGRRPLAYYDNRPSFVAEYQVSLEALSAGVTLALAALCAALAVMLGKAIDYFFGGSKGGDGGSSNASAVAAFNDKFEYKGKVGTFTETLHMREMEIISHFKEAGDIIDQAYEEIQAKQQSRGKTFSDLNSMFEAAIHEKGEDAFIGRMLYADDPMTLDLIENGVYCKTMAEAAAKVGRTMVTWIQKIESAIGEVTKDYPEVMTNTTWAFIPSGYFSRASDTRKMFETESIEHYGIPKTNQRIDEARTKMNEKAVPHRFKFSELHQKVGAGVSRLPLADMLEVFERSEKIMPEVKAKLEKLSQGVGSFENKEKTSTQMEYQEIVTHVVKDIRHHVMEVVKFLSELDRFGRHLRQIESRMFKLQTEAVKLIGEDAKKNGTHTPEMQKLEKELLAKLTVTI